MNCSAAFKYCLQNIVNNKDNAYKIILSPKIPKFKIVWIVFPKICRRMQRKKCWKKY